MTTLVVLDDRAPQGRWRRFWRQVSGRRVTASAARTAGVAYCRLTVRADEGVPWAEVAAAVGGGPAVFEKGVRPPLGCGVVAVDGEPLRRRLLLNGALRALEDAARVGDVGGVALLDRYGRYGFLLPRMMQACRCVTVVTAEGAAYRRLSEELYQTLGAAPLVVDRVDGLTECRALLAPEGLSGFGAVACPPLLFSPDAREGLTLAAEDVPTPFEPALCERFDAFALLTAFRRERPFRDVARLVPAAFRERERAVPLAEASARFFP